MAEFKIKHNEGVTVSTNVYYFPMETCPRASKVILLNMGGVGIIGQYFGEVDHYKGWFPMPKERKNG